MPRVLLVVDGWPLKARLLDPLPRQAAYLLVRSLPSPRSSVTLPIRGDPGERVDVLAVASGIGC